MKKHDLSNCELDCQETEILTLLNYVTKLFYKVQCYYFPYIFYVAYKLDRKVHGFISHYIF